jgi:outer membrane protein TolC
MKIKNNYLSIKIIYLIVMQFIITFNLYCENLELTLDDAIKLAISNNKELKIQQLNIQKAELMVNEARGNAFPSLDFSSSFYHYIQKPIFFFPDFQAMLTNAAYDILFKEKLLPEDNSKFLPMGMTRQSFVLDNQFETKIQLTQVLFNSVVFRGITTSKIYLEISKASYQSTLSNVIANTKKAFYSIILTKNVFQIYDESLHNARENLNLIKSLHSQGLVSDFDLMQAEVQVENLIPVVQNFENLYNNSINALKLLLDIPMQDTLSIVGNLEYIDYNFPTSTELIQQGVENNLDIRTIKFKSIVDKEMVELYRSESYPSIVAFGNYSYAGQANNLKFNTYSQSIVGVQLNLNLFNGMQTSNRIQKATLEYKQTVEQLHQLESYIAKTIQEKLNEFKKAKSQIMIQKKNIELAQKAYEIAQKRYKEGTSIQLEVKNAELELRQAKINLQQSIFEYLLAKIDIDNILGKTNYEE